MFGLNFHLNDSVTANHRTSGIQFLVNLPEQSIFPFAFFFPEFPFEDTFLGYFLAVYRNCYLPVLVISVLEILSN